MLDPDAIAKSIQETLAPSHSDIEAGKRVLLNADELIVAGQSFTVETTLSGNTYLKMAVRANMGVASSRKIKPKDNYRSRVVTNPGTHSSARL